MTTEEITQIKKCSETAFRGNTIRQAFPTCECGKTFDEKQICDAPGVFYKELEVFGKMYTLLEPICPVCKQRVPASYYILN